MIVCQPLMRMPRGTTRRWFYKSGPTNAHSIQDGFFLHKHNTYAQCKLDSHPPQRVDLGGPVMRASVHGLAVCAALADGTVK